jgi:hypothetical protein
MLFWVYKIVIGLGWFQICRHKYKIMTATDVYSSKIKIGIRYTLQCQKCGHLNTYEDYKHEF